MAQNQAQEQQEAGIFQPLGNTKRWRVAQNQAEEQQQAEMFWPLGNTQKGGGWPKSGTGKASGWDFLSFRKHSKKVKGGMNQAQKKHQSGIILPVPEQLLNFPSTINPRDEL